MRVPDWVRKYMKLEFKPHGRDWDGVDCYGLLRLIYREQLDIELPSYDESYERTSDGQAVEGVLKEKCQEAEEWSAIEPGREAEYDAALLKGYFREGGKLIPALMHVGVVAAPGILIHCERGINASLADYRNDPRFKSGFIEGFYRHRRLHANHD